MFTCVKVIAQHQTDLNLRTANRTTINEIKCKCMDKIEQNFTRIDSEIDRNLRAYI